MKILLDECLPHEFRHSFPGHDVHTVRWAGFQGRRNGDLLREAELAGYQVLLAMDRAVEQSDFAGRRFFSR
jgi:predicted nuclease of predicted toxin-antitoxin system